jgi:hypothetical protein
MQRLRVLQELNDGNVDVIRPVPAFHSGATRRFAFSNSGSRPQDRRFGVGEFFVAAVVAAFVDEFLGGGEVSGGGVPGIVSLAEEESGAVEMNVSEEQRHRATGGDFPGFVQVALPSVPT